MSVKSVKPTADSQNKINGLMLISFVMWNDQEAAFGRGLGGIAYTFHRFLITVIGRYKASLKFWGFEACPTCYQNQWKLLFVLNMLWFRISFSEAEDTSIRVFGLCATQIHFNIGFGTTQTMQLPLQMWTALLWSFSAAGTFVFNLSLKTLIFLSEPVSLSKSETCSFWKKYSPNPSNGITS